MKTPDSANYSDEQLTELLRAGDDSVGDLLMDRYKGLVRKKARRLYLEGGDTEDLIQEGMLGLFRAIREYDPERKVPFCSFAELLVTRQMYNAVEAAARKKHEILNNYVPIEEENAYQAFVPGPEETVMENAGADELLEKIKSALSPMETRVLELYLEGLNYREIAEKLGRSGKSVDNALQRIRSKGSAVISSDGRTRTDRARKTENRSRKR